MDGGSTAPRRANGVPQPAAGLPRPRLFHELDIALASRLVVLRGPSGSGRTTLIADWLRTASAPGRAVWVALDAGAQSRAAVWHRIVVAFASESGSRPVADAALGDADVERTLHLLREDIGEDDVVLVLDDLDHADDAVAEDLRRLLEAVPTLRIVATTRRRHAIESAAAATRAGVAGFSDESLAFTRGESAAIAAAAGLDAKDAGLLFASTAGNPLTTRLALAFLPQPSPAEPRPLPARLAIAASRQLLLALDPEVRDPVVRLALAPRVDETLARELTGRADAGALLTRLADEGLGSIRDAGYGPRFTFHPALVAAFRAADPVPAADDPVAHRRIAALLEADGDVVAAVRQLSAAGLHGELWPVIARHHDAFGAHYADELEAILGQLSPTDFRRHGELGAALAILRRGRESVPSARTIALADGALETLPPRLADATAEERMLLLGAIYGAYRAGRRLADAAEAGAAIVEASAAMPADTRRETVDDLDALSLQIAADYVLLGRHDDAVEAARSVDGEDNPWRRLESLGLTAMVEATRGHIAEARSVAAAVPALERPAGWRGTRPAAGWHVADALLRLELGDAAGALNVLAEQEAHLANSDLWPYLVWARATVRLHALQHDIGADELMRTATRFRRRPVLPSARDLLAAAASDLLLAAGQAERAARALAGRSPDSPGIAISRARIAIATGRLTDATELLAPVSWPDGCTPRQQAEALLLRAVTSHRLGLEGEALRAARRAFGVLEAHGLRTPLAMVPRAELSEIVARAEPDWAVRIMSVADPFGAALAADTLTLREREVLVALATAPTIEAVASGLYVSVNTIKTQLRSIYRKLGVSSRDDAVRVARLRGLLPG